MKKRVKDEEQKNAIQLNYFLEMVPNNPQLPKVPRKSYGHEKLGSIVANISFVKYDIQIVIHLCGGPRKNYC